MQLALADVIQPCDWTKWWGRVMAAAAVGGLWRGGAASFGRHPGEAVSNEPHKV